jgi:ATP-dependent Clp protease adaptor protein ClpS
MSWLDHDLSEGVATDVRREVREPSMCKVLLHNDDYTTMDFVLEILENVFHKSPAEATQIMLHVHHRGIGMCGIYPAEIAETKISLVHTLARKAGYPLKASMEPA